MKTIPINRVVAENLIRLMDSGSGPDTVAALAAAARVGGGTIQRIKSADVSCGIDTLQAIASAYDLEPWQLLVPAIDPKNPPALRQLSQEEAALYRKLQALLTQRGSN